MSVPTTAANATAGSAISANPFSAPAAPTATGGDAALFQMLLSAAAAPIAQGAAPIATSAQTNTTQPSATFAALVLQTQDAQASVTTPAQTPTGDQSVAQTAVADEAATPAPLLPASLSTAETSAPTTTQAAPVAQTPESAAKPGAPTAAAPQAENAVLAHQTASPEGQAAAPQTTTAQAAPVEGEAEAAAQPEQQQQAQDQPAVSADPTLTPPPNTMTIAAAGMAAQQAKPQTAAKPAEENTFENVSPFKAVKKTATGASDKAAANSAAPTQANAATAAKTAAIVIPAPALDGGEQQPTGAIASSISYPGAEAARASAEAAAAPRPGAQSQAAMSLAQQIARRYDGQSTSFTMRMDPPELGRVDVQLSVGRDKRVIAKIGADSMATLTELRGAARELERALNEAGLDLAQDGLSFDLNDQRQSSDDSLDAPIANSGASADQKSAQSAPPVSRPFGMERWGASGVDVWA